MALSVQAKKRLIGLHGWLASLLAILFYALILSGTVIVFLEEIEHWSQGRTHDSTQVLSRPLDQIVARYAAEVPPSQRQQVAMFPGQQGSLRLMFSGPEPDASGRMITQAHLFQIAGDSGAEITRSAGPLSELSFDEPDRALERFLFELHARLHIPGRLGLYATGALGVGLLILVATGVLIHRHILKELFVTERPGGRIVSLRDRHNLVGVWSLPFAVLLSFTGAFLSFAVSLGLPIVALIAFGGDQEAAIDFALDTPPEGTGVVAQMADLDAVIADATARVGRAPNRVQIHNYGQGGAEIRIRHPAPADHMRAVELVYDGTSAAFQRQKFFLGNSASAGTAVAELMTPLHFGNFAGIWSKILWAALGGAMTYSVITGLQLWLRRRDQDPVWQAGDRLFTGVVWGLPIAMVGSGWGFFLTRLTGDPSRWTANGFLICVGAVLMWVWLMRALPPAQAARRLCRALGVALLGLPVIRLQMGGLSWGEAILFGGYDLLFIELLCLIGGAICLWRS